MESRIFFPSDKRAPAAEESVFADERCFASLSESLYIVDPLLSVS